MLSIQQFEAVAEASNDGIVVCEYSLPLCPIVYVNAAYKLMSGCETDELLGQPLSFLSASHNHTEDTQALQEALAQGSEFSIKMRSANKDGRTFWNQTSLSFIKNNDTISHVIVVNRDITREEYLINVLGKVNILYREMSKRLEYTNETDPLTLLKTRCHLSTRGEFILGAAKREKLKIHALFLQISTPSLHRLTDTTDDGDTVLMHAAEIIRSFFSRATDISVRLSDTEFVILCIEDDDQRILARARRLHSEVIDTHSLSFTHPNIEVTASIGIHSITPDKYTTMEDLLEHAQRAAAKADSAIAHSRA